MASSLRAAALGFRRALSAREGLASHRRLLSSGTSAGQSPNEKVKKLHQSLEELDMNVQKRYIIYASLQKLVAEQKLRNPFVQWSWQVGAVALIVFAGRWVGSSTEDN